MAPTPAPVQGRHLLFNGGVNDISISLDDTWVHEKGDEDEAYSLLTGGPVKKRDQGLMQLFPTSINLRGATPYHTPHHSDVSKHSFVFISYVFI